MPVLGKLLRCVDAGAPIESVLEKTMNDLILAAYGLSIKAAENIVLINSANSDIEMQMRDRNGTAFHRMQLNRKSS